MNPHAGLRLLLVCLLAVFAQGCVTVYQPLSALQRPVVVDPGYPNFEGTRMLVRCVPNDVLPPGDAEDLCRRVSTLFRNQGATVESEVPREGRGSTRAEEENGKPELIVDLKSRRLHENDRIWLALISGLTLTLVPAISEHSFSQEVTVRDSSGSVLATDTFESRFVKYTGILVWGANWIADLAVRDDQDDMAGEQHAKNDYSRDLYGQLSQLAFNAKVRAKVLRDFAPAPTAPTKSDDVE
jgi:hypothetical protein